MKPWSDEIRKVRPREVHVTEHEFAWIGLDTAEDAMNGTRK